MVLFSGIWDSFQDAVQPVTDPFSNPDPKQRTAQAEDDEGYYGVSILLLP